jgi:predicted ATPase
MDSIRPRARPGKKAEARQLLAPIYGWFTEGVDTADVEEAGALLRQLAGPRLRLTRCAISPHERL